MNTSKQIIGFASQYYTLWSYSRDVRYVTDVNGNHRPSYYQESYVFHKNISKDIEKVKQLYPNLSIDETLRGRDRSFSVKGNEDLTPELIKFGKYYGYTINEIAEMDFDYLLWLEGSCYNQATRELIQNHPLVVEHYENIRLEEQKKIDAVRSTFLKKGEYTIRFERNPNDSLHRIGHDISFDYECPQFVRDNLAMWKRIEETMEGGRVESLASTTGEINGVKYLIVFPQSKYVGGMYPYTMGYINGKLTKTKNKEFTTLVTPIGFAHGGDESHPFYQILLVVS
jgi:hypothetical protein